jgi:hypothetical protein
MVQIGFYLSKEHGSEAAEVWEAGRYPSAAYTFEIDGIAINADEDLRPEAEPSWRIEVISMSLQLLEGVTAMRTGRFQAAGCFYDYVELELHVLPEERIEIRSFYTSDSEPKRIGTCAASDFWPGFAAATDDWMVKLRRFVARLANESEPVILQELRHQALAIKPELWEEAYANWQKVYLDHQ